MIDLQAIKAATLEYEHTDRDDEEWSAVESNFHVLAADPENILAMTQELEEWRAGPSREEMVALCKLVRDLTGYIEMKAGGKPGPVRDDLLTHAYQLLGVVGL